MRYGWMVASVMAAGVAGAAVAPYDPVEARQSSYDLMGAAFGAMKRDVRAGADPGVWADDAGAFARYGKIIPSLFPEGSGTAKSKAKPEVWTDNAGFVAASETFVAAASKLEVAAKAGDRAAFAAAFGETGKACGACHRAYKVKDEE